MRVYSKSDIGLKRNSNQDYCKTGAFPDGSVWAVVCDGMGGANGGCTASRVAAETIADGLVDSYRSDMNEEEIKKILNDTVQNANKTVYDIAAKDESLYGMGTTVVCCIVKDNQIYIVHAGDSRAYLCNGDTLFQITTDHSMVQEMVSAGQITPEEARNHPNRNIITRALGIEAELCIDYTTVGFEEDSVLILCTDGLSNYITEESLMYYIRNYSGEEVTEKLIESAKELGGSDNITVAVISAELS